MPLTPEQHDRACENRGRALVLLAQGPHCTVLEVAVEKWLREVDGDVERLLADIPVPLRGRACGKCYRM